PRVAARTFPANLVARHPVSALSHGNWNRAYHNQYAGRVGSARRKADRVCSHPEIPRGIEKRYCASHEIPQAPRLGAVDRTSHRDLFRLNRLLCGVERELLDRSLPDAFRVRVLVHGAYVAAAGPSSQFVSQPCGEPFEAIPSRCLNTVPFI